MGCRRWYAGLAIAAAVASPAQADPGHQVRVDLGVAAPTGQAALRYRVEPTAPGPGLEVGIGLAYTGLSLGAMVVLPIRTFGPDAAPTRLLGYGGYSLAVLSDATRHPLAAENRFVADGRYHWIDAGVLFERRVKHLVIVAGLGLGVLVAAPEGDPLQPDDDATVFNGEWWIDKRVAPSLWAGVGWSF